MFTKECRAGQRRLKSCHLVSMFIGNPVFMCADFVFKNLKSNNNFNNHKNAY